MPPQECIDKGCHDRMVKLEEQMMQLTNPEDGALGQLHEKVNGVEKSNVSFKLFIWAVGAAFTFTGLCTGALYKSRQELFAAQDKRIEEGNTAQNMLIQDAINEVRAMRKDIEDTKIAIEAHRAFTEGWKKKER